MTYDFFWNNIRIYVTHMQTKKGRENLGDISIIARRLEDGHVQYGWSGMVDIIKW